MLEILLFSLPSLRPFSHVREDGCGWDLLIFPPTSAWPDESQEEKLVHDPRCPEVMPSLEELSASHRTLQSEEFQQESELLLFFPTTSELLRPQVKERQCQAFPGCSV